ncbi:MAG: SpoIIE family protein phosphatase [Planctomycetota bacterium]
MSRASQPLSLRPITPVEPGQSIRAVELPIDRPLLVGRSSEADWAIAHPSVSRRHASIRRTGDTWLITDLASRHGTSVNDRRIEPSVPAPIEDGDVLTFGAWRCRCASGTARAGATTPFEPMGDEPASVNAIPAQQLGGVAQRGLDVLMALTGELDEAGTREAVARAAADAVREATGCRRVVLVEPASEDELIVLASTAEDTPRVSRSLIELSAKQGLVQLLASASVPDHAQSIMDLGIRSAICAPVLVDGLPTAFMMIDTRHTEGVVPSDAASFCQSVARLVGLAFQRLSSVAMAERHRQLQADLDAARRAQELLSPSKKGRFGDVAYRFESLPGRVVAGDLFDVFQLDQRRTAFFLGDVAGKGVGAAMLMAACQSQLRSQLLSGAELSSAMSAVNADLHQRSESSKFITLIAAVIDSTARTARVADAGHGLLLRVGPRGIERLSPESGFPLGVVDAADYPCIETPLAAGEGLVTFSDGAVEQTNDEGAQLGVPGVVEAMRGLGSPMESVDTLISSVQGHASGPLADDLTAAAVWLE